jgi:hypothetical protein
VSAPVAVAAFADAGKVVTRLVHEDGTPGDQVVWDQPRERWCLVGGHDHKGRPTPGDAVDLPEAEPAVITPEQAQRGALRRAVQIALGEGNEVAAVYLARNPLLNDDMRMDALEVLARDRADASRLLTAAKEATRG